MEFVRTTQDVQLKEAGLGFTTVHSVAGRYPNPVRRVGWQY
jgi:hypothetical protein